MNGSWPAAYKVGLRDFYGRDFIVSPGVLIPRPETEQMIDMLLGLAGKAYLPGVKPGPAVLSANMRVLDVGTGSGCIAVTVALELPESEVTAIDISEAALAITERNAAKWNARVKTVRSDLLTAVDVTQYDVILANLPYVDRNWEWLDHEALSVEPEVALFAEDGGLELIKKLLRQAECAFEGSAELRRASAPLARNDGPSGRGPEKVRSACRYILLEADPCQHEAIVQYAETLGFRHIETRGFIMQFTY